MFYTLPHGLSASDKLWGTVTRKGTVLERLNTKYYNLNDFHDALDKISGEEVEVDDTILTPFYICKSVL